MPASRRSLAALAAGAVVPALLLAAPGAQGANLVTLQKSGATQLKLTSSAAKELRRAKVTLSASSPAKRQSGGISFPIRSGSIDPQLDDGATINHTGGLRLTRGSRKATISNPRINVGAAGSSVSATLGGATGALFTLDTSKRTLSGRNPITRWRLSNVTLKLNKRGASALNKNFRTKFKTGSSFATAVTTARLAELIAQTGQTKLTLGSELNPLLAAGMTVTGIAPGTVAGTVVTLPVASSKFRADLTSGTILHTGGVVFAKGANAIRNEAYEVRFGGSPVAAASVNGGATKVPLLDLDLGNAEQDAQQPLLIRGVVAKLNAASAGGLSGLAGLGAPLAAGTTAGTIEMSLNIR
jgi:hypothetical protein